MPGPGYWHGHQHKTGLSAQLCLLLASSPTNILHTMPGMGSWYITPDSPAYWISLTANSNQKQEAILSPPWRHCWWCCCIGCFNVTTACEQHYTCPLVVSTLLWWIVVCRLSSEPLGGLANPFLITSIVHLSAVVPLPNFLTEGIYILIIVNVYKVCQCLMKAPWQTPTWA